MTLSRSGRFLKLMPIKVYAHQIRKAISHLICDFNLVSMNYFNKTFNLRTSLCFFTGMLISLSSCLNKKQNAVEEDQPFYLTKSVAALAPEENRFVKTVLVNDLNEPMELAVAKDGSVFYAERKGKVWAYNCHWKTYFSLGIESRD
jgi:hypothetical protein